MKILRYAVSLLVTLLKIGLSLVLAVVTMILVANLWVILTAQPRTIDVGSLADQPRRLVERVGSDAPPILVLGAGVINNEEPSRVLALRLEAAWQVHQALPDAPLVMSGDHREDNYNEVAVMKDYLVQKGVPSTQIYLDHAGYSTYESLYRFKEVFGQERGIIVTQGYHLSRALMLARGLGIDAWGVASEDSSSTRWQREFREVFARLKDIAITYFNYEPDPSPELGYGYSLDQISGDQTHDKEALEVENNPS